MRTRTLLTCNFRPQGPCNVCDQKLVSVSTMRSIIVNIDGEFGITFKLDINMTITILI